MEHKERGIIVVGSGDMHSASLQLALHKLEERGFAPVFINKEDASEEDLMEKIAMLSAEKNTIVVDEGELTKIEWIGKTVVAVDSPRPHISITKLHPQIIASEHYEDGLSKRERSQIIEPIRMTEKIPRNRPCPCGSGKKYKHCHGK